MKGSTPPARTQRHLAASLRLLFCTLVFAATASTALASSPADPQHGDTLDWGQDILIGTTGTRLYSGKLSTDADTNGDIYVGVLDPDSSGRDTVHVWRSTNGGDSWTRVYYITSDSITGPIRDYELRVGHDAGGTWVYDFLVFEGTGAPGGLWAFRHRDSMLQQTWVRIVPGGDTILSLSADRNIEWPEHLFVAWETGGGLINAASSSDSGQTWGNYRTVFTDSRRPSICAGGDGAVYVAAGPRDSSFVSVARYSDNLANPTPVVTRLDSSSDRRVWDPSVAADRNTAESLQTAIVMYSHRDTAGKIAPHFGWTRTGGRTWASNVWPATNQARTTWDARYPRVRQTYDDNLFRAVVTMHEPSRNWDTLVYAFARPSTPLVWEDRAVRNESRSSDAIGAGVGFSRTCMGGYVAYTMHSFYRVYYDGYSLVGAPEPPVPPRGSHLAAVVVRGGSVDLRLDIERAGPVRIAAFDGAGRMIARPFKGMLSGGAHRVRLQLHAPAGCVLLRIDTPGNSETTKLVVAR